MPHTRRRPQRANRFTAARITKIALKSLFFSDLLGAKSRHVGHTEYAYHALAEGRDMALRQRAR